MSNRKSRRQAGGANVLKGLAAGLVGGLIASWTMNQFQALTGKLTEEIKSATGEKQAKSEKQKEGDDATMKAAQAISVNVFDHKLTKSEKKVAGPAVHYTFGTAAGGIYGALAEVAPIVGVWGGLPFSAVFWLIADETTVPALGLSEPLTEVPLSSHASALAAHVVYGLTTDVVRRAVRRAL